MTVEEMKELHLLNFKKSQEEIDIYLNLTEEYDQDFVKLIHALASTDRNPYSFLQERWATSMESAEGCACFFRNLHHAIVDDGDVCFTSVIFDSPCLLFMDKWAMRENTREDCQRIYK